MTTSQLDPLKSDVKTLLSQLTTEIGGSSLYILIGGSALILYGSSRTTNDIDLLIPQNVIDIFTTLKNKLLAEQSQASSIEKIDLLSSIVDRFDYASIVPYTADILGIQVPELDVFLGTKVLCQYYRSEGEAGDGKRASDVMDIIWISHELQKRGQVVRKEVAEKFCCGPYNMLLVLVQLDFESKGAFEVFEVIGGREFEWDWVDLPERYKQEGDQGFEEDSKIRQTELYEMEISNFEEEEVKRYGSRRRALRSI